MQADRLAGQVGDHGEELHVLVITKLRAAVAPPINGQCAEDLVVYLDWHADEGDGCAVVGFGFKQA